MSPRPKRFRKLGTPPKLKGFKPIGVPLALTEPISIQFEEYEALRLADYEGLSHLEAAKRMNVSRPTFTRIYEKIRKKLARAFVEGNPLIIEGGDVEFDKEWYRCADCYQVFHLAEGQELNCPACGSTNLEHINASVTHWRHRKGWGPRKGYGQSAEGTGRCMCPECETEVEHQPGIPCSEVQCPKCHHSMMRKN